ncbi:MAG: cellulose synthase subunit BcsC-related outer membrane protein [Limnobacter sp.]|uniref:cellulose synthase subunit BcsC-related outer membrane protein n=1 Tax=Limnobacter sp. TaxID=2003368 RepID=UPI0022C634F6|nr:cellulose synthase subunit BcsC-related outer membrane protein [Limnobacter sp.]MCZ8015991.1 cellulose synthase subunit BcsC-related outer membrane protein [Limnobacter sp.]
MAKARTFNWRSRALALAIRGCFATSTATLFAIPALAAVDAQQSNVRALSDKGIYWYERFRFDLAVQSFNKVLLIDPANASALRWQGLIDLARGDVQAANVWLGKLQITHGNHPFAIELQQAINLAGEKRQQLAELRYLADSEKVPADLPKKLQALLPQPPLGDAAVQIYKLMGRTPEGRAKARPIALELARRFPEDKRYKALLADLGAASAQPVGNSLQITRNSPASAPRGAATAAKPADIATQDAPATVPTAPVPDAAPELSAFEQGQQLADQAQRLIDAGDRTAAARNLQQAVDLNPTYPWFRYDLATLLDDQGDAESKQSARKIMDEGLSQNKGQEMRFASALLAARQDRGMDALALMNAVPKTEWTEGMSALEKRVSYGQYLNSLRTLEQESQFNAIATALGSAPRWRAEPEVQDIEQSLRRKQQVRVRMSYENALIDGDEGVSKINSNEIPLQIDLPLDFEKTLFVRADTLNANSGRVNLATTTNFAKLGTTIPTDPAIANERLDQNFKGHVLGVGVQTDQYRIDLGTTVGDYPVNDWVGGLQWRTNLGNGSLRLELARRMVNGSALSTTGAIDPLTGERWGGARRNGVSAVYYEALSPTLDFVGIARANLITGENIPDNTEFNLQGIVGKTVFQRPGHRVEVGASLFLWSFEKNLRFYTFGQGGYYSPQAFGSLSFPVTWTGNVNGWSWQMQARIGASESREDDANLYPLNPELAAAAAAQGNATIETGGPGGGTSTGLRLALERQVLNNFVLGGYFEIDRSEGYNPDRLQLYLKYSFGDFFELSVPPEGVAPYSRF